MEADRAGGEGRETEGPWGSDHLATSLHTGWRKTGMKWSTPSLGSRDGAGQQQQTSLLLYVFF